MEKVLFSYLVLSNICVIVWVYKNQDILNTKNLHVLRRYLVSITIGPFIVIPFWLSLLTSSIIRRRGEKLADIGGHLTAWMINDQKIYGDKHTEMYEDLIKKFYIKFKTFKTISSKYIAFQEKYVMRMSKWLGRNYI